MNPITLRPRPGWRRRFFEHFAVAPPNTFLHRELLDPVGADVFLGTPPEQDARIATLYPVMNLTRVANMVVAAVPGGSTESNVARSFLRGGVAKSALLKPRSGGAIRRRGSASATA